KIGQRLTDDGLGAPQAAACGREAAGVGRCDKGAQLIKREAVQHLSSPSMGSSDKYRLLRWISRPYLLVSSIRRGDGDQPCNTVTQSQVLWPADAGQPARKLPTR